MAIYHYTCHHGHAALGDIGTVQPPNTHSPQAMERLQPWQRGLGALCWFTDLDYPMREALGLTQSEIYCDRTQYRYYVLNRRSVVAWLESPYRHDPFLRKLELTPGALPRHWYVADHGVAVAIDRAWSRQMEARHA